MEATFIQDNSFFETAANMQGIKIKCETVDQYQPEITRFFTEIIISQDMIILRMNGSHLNKKSRTTARLPDLKSKYLPYLSHQSGVSKLSAPCLETAAS